MSAEAAATAAAKVLFLLLLLFPAPPAPRVLPPAFPARPGRRCAIRSWGEYFVCLLFWKRGGGEREFFDEEVEIVLFFSIACSASKKTAFSFFLSSTQTTHSDPQGCRSMRDSVPELERAVPRGVGRERLHREERESERMRRESKKR